MVVAAVVGLAMPDVAAAEGDGAGQAVDPSRAVYLVAARQKPRIAESLRRAQVQVVADILDSPALLRVTVGNEKGFRSCGTRNNVKYSLRIGVVEALQLTEDGWTGTCEPNVFDALSARLARALSETHQGEIP